MSIESRLHRPHYAFTGAYQSPNMLLLTTRTVSNTASTGILYPFLRDCHPTLNPESSAHPMFLGCLYMVCTAAYPPHPRHTGNTLFVKAWRSIPRVTDQSTVHLVLQLPVLTPKFSADVFLTLRRCLYIGRMFVDNDKRQIDISMLSTFESDSHLIPKPKVPFEYTPDLLV
jgi:hypothetical protein